MATTTLTGTTGNDILNAPGSVTTLVAGLDGNDSITLTKALDEAEAGAGNDSITLASGASTNIVSGGAGNDTLYALTGTTTIGGSLGLNDGDDLFVNSNNVQIVGASIGGNAGSDTLTLGSGGVLNSTIGGGKNNDTITIATGTVTNSQVLAGGGKDTITLVGGVGAMTLTTINSGDGHDKVIATGLLGSTSNIIALGKGYDSISLGTGSYGTIAGGALADTVTFVGDVGVAGEIYGDGLGDKTGATSSAGGADYLSTTYNAVAATSIYGAAGNDTVIFNKINAAALVDGGKGADVLGNTAMVLTGASPTLNGGEGADTIKFDAGGTVTTAGILALGGAGHDSIYMLSAGVASINGGAGNDTLQMALTTLKANDEIATLNGGDGTDRLHIGNFVGAGLTAGGFTSLADAGGLANVVYGAGDSVFITLTANVTAANFNANNQIWIASSLGTIGGSAQSVASGGTIYGLLYGNDGTLTGGTTTVTAGTGAVVGSVGVYDSGDDLVIGIVGATTKMSFIQVVGGGSLIKSTTTQGNVVQGSSNFGFTVSSTTTGFTITFA